MDNIGKLTEDELKKEVDEAVGNLVTPLKMKSHLITQLKTQIEDLEMFIEFLQGEASTISPGEGLFLLLKAMQSFFKKKLDAFSQKNSTYFIVHFSSNYGALSVFLVDSAAISLKNR